MAILTPEVVKFAAGDSTFYEAAVDNYLNPTPEKSQLLQLAYFAEMERKSGVSREGISEAAWCNHPSVRWAFLSIVDATIQAIYPSILTNAFGVFMDLRYVGVGDILKIKVLPNQLFTVSAGGRGERTTHRQKDFAADVIIAPQEHLVTVYVDMYRVMAGKESIGDFIARVVLSAQQTMYAEALNALTTGLTAVTAGTSYNYTGAFDMKTLIQMAEQVQVYNYGVRSVIAGSAVALMNVIPDSAYGWRMNVDGARPVIELTQSVLGFDILKLDQAAAQGGGLVLPDDTLYVVSPAQDKLVKGNLRPAC